LNTFAGRAAYRSWIERVELTGPDREAAGALERWAALERAGWDIQALVDVAGTHMIGLGCLYLEQPATEAC
jgi:hypothetical protein